MTGDCAITILLAKGRRLAKLIRTDGSVAAYDDARTFDAVERVVHDLDHLAELLRWLLPRPDRCIVRGSLLVGSPAYGIRRLLHPDRANGDAETLYEIPRRWAAIDVDGVPRPPEIPAADVAACAQIAIQHLPEEFHGRRCIAVATASHGIKPGCRLRLWFWLDGAAVRKTLQAWLLNSTGVDMASFRPAQICYTAAPILAPGVADPVPERIEVLPGEPLVPIRSLPPPAPSRAIKPSSPPARVRADQYRDAALTAIAARIRSTGVGNRHGTLVAEACALFKLATLSDAYVSQFIHAAAAALNDLGDRQIPPEEVDELLGWARARAA